VTGRKILQIQYLSDWFQEPLGMVPCLVGTEACRGLELEDEG